MRRILFVANGHGENAIAARIGRELAEAAHDRTELELLPLVGTGRGTAPLAVVGPRAVLPSGGLVAMGNVAAFSRDLRAGFARLFARQVAFLRAARHRYDAVVAVGDAYVLGMALLARTATAFVGTAKSVYVAPYGPFERALLRRARLTFVRDEPTAQRLCAQGVRARAPGNAIVDLVRPGTPALAGAWLGILPGSREGAYADALRLVEVAAALARVRPGLGLLLSVSPTLDPARFAREFGERGWLPDSAPPDAAFAVRAGDLRLVGWQDDLGRLLAACLAVLGQAGTANEQAAAFGVPVIALAGARGGSGWYRMRQRRLLGDALMLVPEDPAGAAAAIARLLGDPAAMARMSAAGRERMGPPGGATAIARAILELPA